MSQLGAKISNAAQALLVEEGQIREEWAVTDLVAGLLLARKARDGND